MTSFTQESLSSLVPASYKTMVTQELADKLNAVSDDPDIAENIRNNFVSYSHILNIGKYSMDEYLNAIKYVSFKLMGLTNQDAYCKTFPDRFTRLTELGKTPKEISAYAYAYHRNKLVAAIMEQSFIPTWILNQDIYQRAINTQAELMLNSKSDRVRAMAADSIMNHLKKPEKIEPLVNIDMRETAGIKELKDMLVSLAQAQQTAVQEKKLTPKDLAEQQIIDAEEV